MYFPYFICVLLFALAVAQPSENDPTQDDNPILAEGEEQQPAAEEQHNQPLCCSPDIVVVIDRTYVDKANYATTVRPVLTQLIDSMNPCVNMRFAFIEYGSSVHIRSLLGDHKLPENARRYVEQYAPGASSLGTKSLLSDAFEGILTQVLTEVRGKRPWSPTYLLLFIGSDGQNPSQTVLKAERLRHSTVNVRIIVFGMGNNYNPEVSRRVASGPHMFFVMEDHTPSDLAATVLPLICTKDVINRPTGAPVQVPATKAPHRNQIKLGLTRPQSNILTPSEQCSKREHRGERLNIRDPENCHNYIACDYSNETISGVIGTIKTCSPSEIFNKDAMMCVPEGPSPCSDYCRHNHLAHNGCYGMLNNCAMFFLCSHGTSYAKCCPSGTHFETETCTCEPNDKCTDTCKLLIESEAYKTYALTDDVTCIDSYNNTLRAHRGRPDLYEVVENTELGTVRFFTVPCAEGSLFSRETCRCEHFSPNNADTKPEKPALFVKGHQCRLYLPFDEDISDHSINRFSIYQQGRVSLNKQNDSARGEGKSLFINHGHLEVPGLSGSDQRNQASWCLFYRCQQHQASFICLKSGGLLSNSRDSFGTGHTIVLASQFKDHIIARLQLIHPKMSVNMNASVDSTYGWNQVCVVYDGANVELYSNGAKVGEEEAHGRLQVVNFPYLIGTDHRYGSFQGSIDDVLMCDHAMSREEVEAHYEGNREYLVAKGLIPAKN